MEITIRLKNINNKDLDIEMNLDLKLKGDTTILEIPKVEDVYRYKINYEDGKLNKINIGKNEEKFEKSNFNDETVEIDSQIPTIVLLLESPHENEYDENNNPIAPAQGATGIGIDENILNVIQEIIGKEENLLAKQEYRLIISNPIQYQTSLFMFHGQKLQKKYKRIRNKVWRELWDESEVQNSFEERIEKYEPDLIINACTADLQNKVTKYLMKRNKNYNIYKAYHPSYWKGFGVEKLSKKK